MDVLRQIPGADVRRMKGGWTIQLDQQEAFEPEMPHSR